MNVILIEDFGKYKSSEIVNFSKGYCVNFLIPKFIAIILYKKLYSILYIFKNLILINDFIKKEFFKKLYFRYNNKNIYLNSCIIKNIFFKNYFLKKIGFIYYNYYILFFKQVEDNLYIVKIKLYNDVYVKFFIYLKNNE